MSKYRIKVIERQSQKAMYYPQVKKFLIWWYIDELDAENLTLIFSNAYRSDSEDSARRIIKVYDTLAKAKKKVKHKKVILVILLLALPLFSKAQIQDSVYENWSTKQDSMAKANLEKLVEYRDDNKKVVKKLLLMGSAIGFFLTVYKRRKDE